MYKVHIVTGTKCHSGHSDWVKNVTVDIVNLDVSSRHPYFYLRIAQLLTSLCTVEDQTVSNFCLE
jgi:hypothetical protein